MKKIESASWQTLFLGAIAFIGGVILTTFFDSTFSQYGINENPLIVIIFLFGLSALEFGVLSGLRRAMVGITQRLKLTPTAHKRFHKYHVFTYAVFLAQALLLGGAKASMALAFFILTLFVLAQLLLLWLAADRPQKEQWLGSTQALPLLFFVSGFSALIYQVVWQRVLFATFGTNIESVTVIVSVFMFGLGIGALVGGQMQKYFANRLLECFVAIEVAIGVFGLFSIPFIHIIGRIAPHDSLLVLIATTYLLLAVPTMLMGSTLPILVGYLQKRFTSIGAMVGTLYAYNTFGSALASFLTVTLLFTMLGQQSTLIIAAICNGVTAYLVWFLCSKKLTQPALLVSNGGRRKSSNALSPQLAFFMAAAIGYISLSLEIIWMRILGFLTSTRPQVFGIMLAIFLGGIAYGSIKAKRWSEAGKNPRDFINRALLQIIILSFISVPLVGLVSSRLDQPVGVVAGYIIVGFLSYFSGGIFPLLCQARGGRGKQTGVTVSLLYFLNIIGATVGSLITGFVLFDILTLGQNILVICAITFGTWLLLQRRFSLSLIGTSMAAVAVMLLLQPMLYDNIFSRLHGFPTGKDLKYVNENRQGIITVLGDKDGDMIYGGGAYDGRFNIDPANDSNIITRAYMIAAIHPHPKRILEIGLSSGSWAKVFTMYKPLKELVSVEINPGYLDAMKNYPDIDSIKTNPKWTHYIDDGRRWLVNHPDEYFDIIVMNTSYYWRSNATNVLSKEFLELCKQHLNPGGVVYYNATSDWDVVYTAATVFDHVATYVNFVVASDTPIDVPYEQRRKNLLRFIGDDDEPIFGNEDPKYGELLEKLANDPIEDIHNTLLAKKSLWAITDDNMVSEYKVDHGFMPAHFQW